MTLCDEEGQQWRDDVADLVRLMRAQSIGDRLSDVREVGSKAQLPRPTLLLRSLLASGSSDVDAAFARKLDEPGAMPPTELIRSR